MTTVVFKDGVFAADSRINGGGYISGSTEKIKKVGDFYVGMSGRGELYNEFCKFIGGEDFNKEKLTSHNAEYGMIVVNSKTKEVNLYIDSLIPEITKNDFYTVGSGYLIATGALLMGATPKKAVQIAAKVDTRTGGKIQVVKVW